MNRLARLFRRKAPATLKREFSVVAFLVWFGVTVRLFASGNPEWIAAQGVNYATLTTTVWLFITAAVGIQAWQNNQATMPTGADYPDGAPEPVEPTPEQRARGGI
jgi:hypothetical protein